MGEGILLGLVNGTAIIRKFLVVSGSIILTKNPRRAWKGCQYSSELGRVQLLDGKDGDDIHNHNATKRDSVRIPSHWASSPPLKWIISYIHLRCELAWAMSPITMWPCSYRQPSQLTPHGPWLLLFLSSSKTLGFWQKAWCRRYYRTAIILHFSSRKFWQFDRQKSLLRPWSMAWRF